MRIAVLLHGHLRSFRNTAASFQERVVEPLCSAGHSVKLFMHTWDQEEFDTKTWHKGASDIKDVDIHEVLETYNIEEILCEKQIIQNPERTMFGRPYEAMKLVWYSFYESWKLMEKHEKENDTFDIVIVTRPDVYHYSDIFLDEIEKPEHIWQTQVFTKKAASDVLLYGGREQVERGLVGFYKQFDDLYGTLNYAHVSNNEVVFNRYLEKVTSVKVSKYCMPVNWRILRSWWDIDHKEGHRKWDRELALEHINKNNRFIYFRQVMEN